MYNGAPSETLTGTELERDFIDLGYELYKDRDSLKTTFVSGDFFNLDSTSLKPGSFDIIHAA